MLLVYGSYGYTGQLIVEEAQRHQLPIVLAGRDENKLKKQAETSGLKYEVFDLEDKSLIVEKIRSFACVLNAAGPFIHTARHLMEACIQSGVHYLDITGEIPVFEMAASFGKRALEKGVMLLPGAGFDVVPTDCMAKHLSERLPDAHKLQLAFSTYGGQVSRGTALTAVENLGMPGAERVNGLIKAVPTGHKWLRISFEGESKRFCMSIPWGDVSTAYYSTGIPNIETYIAIPEKSYRRLQFFQKFFGFILRYEWLKNLIRSRIRKMPPGPSDTERKSAKTIVWGRAENEKGDFVESRVIVPEGYTLTAMSSVLMAQKVLAGKTAPGFQTPSKWLGSGLLKEICQSEFENI